MTEIEYILERSYTSDEMIKRLTLIIANALPHTTDELSNLYNEWAKILNDIDQEYKDSQ